MYSLAASKIVVRNSNTGFTAVQRGIFVSFSAVCFPVLFFACVLCVRACVRVCARACVYECVCARMICLMILYIYMYIFLHLTTVYN